MRSFSFLGPKRRTRINEWCTRSSLQLLSRPSIITSRLFLSTACAGITPASLSMGPIFYMCRVCRDHVSLEPFLYTCRITRPCTSQCSVTYRTTGLTPSHMSDQRDFPSLKVAEPMNYINSDIYRYLLKCNKAVSTANVSHVSCVSFNFIASYGDISTQFDKKKKKRR